MATRTVIDHDQLSGSISITIHPPVITTRRASVQGVLNCVNFQCVHCGADNQLIVKDEADSVNEDVDHRTEENNNVEFSIIDLTQEDRKEAKAEIVHKAENIEANQQEVMTIEQNGQMINQEVNHHATMSFADELDQYLLGEKENIFDDDILLECLNEQNMRNAENARITTEYYHQSQGGYWSPTSNHYSPFPRGYF